MYNACHTYAVVSMDTETDSMFVPYEHSINNHGAMAFLSY